MRISDWSSDVCSSDLLQRIAEVVGVEEGFRLPLLGLEGFGQALGVEPRRQLGVDGVLQNGRSADGGFDELLVQGKDLAQRRIRARLGRQALDVLEDRKSTRLNSSH